MAEIRLPAEVKFADELRALAAADQAPRPPGWALSPQAALSYVLGADAPVGGVRITPKYVGDRALVEVAIATLASERALLLVGEPGTAKSWLSEHLAAAIGGTSGFVVQGTAGTSEEQVKYSWNYALLLAEGPSPKALVPSPIYRAMEAGKVARFEEVTRASSEIQDALISILSEKQIAIPELGTAVSAQHGFNLIATANTRDRGVNEMSAALKRRFNFVTVPVVDDLDQEIAIVVKREAELRSDYQVGVTPPAELVRMLVTVFHEMRAGMTRDGKTRIKAPAAPLSTAEAISVLFQSSILAACFGKGQVTATDVGRSLVGAVARAGAEDLAAVKEYAETVAKGRKGPWKELGAALRDA
jgi:MoxR-like ATPase